MQQPNIGKIYFLRGVLTSSSASFTYVEKTLKKARQIYNIKHLLCSWIGILREIEFTARFYGRSYVIAYFGKGNHPLR